MHYSSLKEAMQIMHPWRLDARAAGVPWLALHLRTCSISPTAPECEQPQPQGAAGMSLSPQVSDSTRGVTRPSHYHHPSFI